ncbi:MAG: hypothetical protein GX089_04315 [Fibrobacter sp.]|jgi:hypothetical protein|nr:hypothetical protein [Fibrobacter sp.]
MIFLILMTFRDYNVTAFVDDSGVKKELACNEIPPEITCLLKTSGFHNIGVFGAKTGCFFQKRYSGNG